MPTTVGCKSPETRQRRFYATAEESCPNLENWGQDSLRHSYASYYYALNKNAHETAEQMGHVGGLRIFFRHYRNRVREEAAREFWAIRPAPSSRVVNSV
jgi:sarcosine oxidase delta subunit